MRNFIYAETLPETMNQPSLEDRVRKSKPAKSITINSAYLVSLKELKIEDWQKKLDKDLAGIGENGSVLLDAPENSSYGGLYADVRAHIALRSIKQHYRMITKNPYDAEMIKAVLGKNNVEGNQKEGYRFKYA